MKKLFTLFAAVLVAGSMMATDLVVDIATIASERSWENSVAQTNVVVDPITFTVSGGGNNGKYYTSDNSWRFYSGGGLSISASEGNNVTAVTTVPAVSFSISAGVATASFSATVRITKITVTYSSGATVCASPTLPVGGFFITAPYDVTITNNEAGATVYYTIDGSEPSASSASFTGESTTVSISDTTTIKAFAMVDGKENSSVVTATYNYVVTTGDGTKENPFTVSDVVALHNPSAKAWAVGTVIGTYAYVDGKNVFVPGVTEASVATNLAISNEADTVAVQLTNGSSARTNLNLVDHPENLGAVIKVNGTFEAYISTCGIKGVGAAASYEIVSIPTAIEAVATERKAIKRIENGRVVIIRDGVRYNAVGTKF